MRERQPTNPSIETDLLNDSANSQFPFLTPGEARAAEQLLIYFDRQEPGGVVGLIGPRSSGKTTLLNTLLAPSSGRPVRTPDHRKVIGLMLDASTVRLPADKSPWQYLVLHVLDVLAAQAMPTERKTINDLRSELLRASRSGTRNGEDSRLAVAAFAHHFRTTFPRLVMNVFSLSNAVLVVGLDHLDQSPGGQVAEWLEAAGYFLSAIGCTVVVCADDAALTAKLGQTGVPADATQGDALLRKWLPRRVTIEMHSAPNPVQAPAKVAAPPAEVTQVDARTQDIPPACMQIITTALQPDRRLINAAIANWHSAMRAIVKRAEDRMGNAISSTVIAKLVALQALSPQLFDAGRYNAQLLVALERQLRGETGAPAADEWYGAVSQHAQLKSLLTANPLLSTLSLRDLATALRLAYSGQEAESHRSGETVTVTPQPRVESVKEPATTPVATPFTTPVAGARASARADAAGPTAQAGPSADLHTMLLGLPGWVSAIVAGGVFAVDRLAKLLVVAIQPATVLTAASSGTTPTSGALAVAAELFGIALCVLILIFWGGTRSQRLYSASLGFILGALVSNLFDRLVYGGVLNFIHIAGLPVFNLSHVALLAGALLLAVSLVRNGLSREAQPSQA